MYWHVKVLLGLVTALFLGALVYLGRNHIPTMPWKRTPPPISVTANPDPTDPQPTVVPPPPPKPIDEATRLKLQQVAEANRKIDGGQLLEARTIGEGLLGNSELEPYSDVWRQAADVVSRVNTIFLTSDAPCPEKVSYVVQGGDSLWKIAQKLGVTMGAIQRGNGLDPKQPKIFPGQALKVFKGEWTLHADKSAFVLIVSSGTRIIKVYNVGIGRQDRTPVGTFLVENRIAEPAWTPPGRNVPFGHPDNVLGTRWLGLKPIEGTNPNLKGYGIHGTWEPDSIGLAASNGCVRMRNPEVEELYDIIPEGTRVTIEE